MTEALNTAQVEESSPQDEVYAKVGVEGLTEVLRWKFHREQEAQQMISPEEKARNAIAKVEDPRAQQALTGDLKDVVRVMTAVETMRAESTEERPITDRDIYLAYRRLTEGESPDPRFEQASKILLNLMGGNVSGKLPF